MTRALLLALGLFLLAGLAFFCLRSHAPDIQADIGKRATQALTSKNVDWATAKVSGRDITLTGLAPDPSSKSAAAAAVRDLIGVRTVDNQISVIEAAASMPVPDLRSAYQASIDYNGQYLSMTGYIEDETEHATLIAHATEIFGAENIVDELKIRPDAPEGWLSLLKNQILSNLKDHESAHITVNKSSLTFEGFIATAKQKVEYEEAIKKGLPAQYAFLYKVGSPLADLPENVPAITEAYALNCQKLFDDAMRGKKIIFQTASSQLATSSSSLLKALAKTAQDCPRVNIEIGGHTDTRGDADMNLKLSQDRADTVQSALISMGVEPAQITAQGYGETQPLSKEKSAEDLERNRRIEFKIIEVAQPLTAPLSDQTANLQE